jgi:hypothetical protein
VFITEPTNPPPPPITNLPFQASGSSSSKFVSVPMTPATLQCGTGASSSVTDVSLTSGSSPNDSALQVLPSAAVAAPSACPPRSGPPQAASMNTLIVQLRATRLLLRNMILLHYIPSLDSRS